VSGGRRGEIPDWLAVVKAAHYYGVPPWVLVAEDPGWVRAALEVESAEAWAQAEIEKRFR